MNSGPNLANIASLIGERARADMLCALLSGKALTATELATVANITKQTASSHLSKLFDRKLVALEKHGRHRYYRLADVRVAEMLETLLDAAQRAGMTRLQTGPGDSALRHARVCYDHLAGELGVQLFDGLQRQRRLKVVGEGAELTPLGEQLCADLGIDLAALNRSRRPLCRVCLDWSERRHHLAGAVGAALFETFLTLGWARRKRDTRIVTLTPTGRVAFNKHFGIRAA